MLIPVSSETALIPKKRVLLIPKAAGPGGTRVGWKVAEGRKEPVCPEALLLGKELFVHHLELIQSPQWQG